MSTQPEPATPAQQPPALLIGRWQTEKITADGKIIWQQIKGPCWFIHPQGTIDYAFYQNNGWVRHPERYMYQDGGQFLMCQGGALMWQVISNSQYSLVLQHGQQQYHCIRLVN